MKNNLKFIAFSVALLLFGFREINKETTWQTFAPLFENNNANAQLIVFYTADNQQFVKETLPQLKKYCSEKKLVLIEKNAAEGVPNDLSSTPALVFENQKGRSIYAARYASFSTIENFIRTSRAFLSKESENNKKEVLLSKNGRMNIAISLKITPFKGNLPSDFDVASFEKNTKQQLDAAMQRFDYQSETFLKKTDRCFYLDIHPFADKQGKVFLSYELYSQFSCTEPTFSKMKTPLESSFATLSDAFATIGKNMEQEIFSQLQNATNGDAYSPIAEKTAVLDWSQISNRFAETAATKTLKNESIAEENIAGQWNFSGAIDSETPMMAFHFMSPLDRYAGEVKSVKGNMQISDNQILSKGFFEVNTASLTMGIADFDKKIHDKYIKTSRFPTATFSFDNQQIALKNNQTTTANITGTFTLVGKKIPLTMNAQLTPSNDEQGQKAVIVQANFDLNISDEFGIKGPDGPTPANKTMQFFLNFYCRR